MKITGKRIEELEAMIDQTSLQYVLEMLVEICGEKAEHLRSNWQDARQAKEWERNAQHIARVAAKVVF